MSVCGQHFAHNFVVQPCVGRALSLLTSHWPQDMEDNSMVDVVDFQQAPSPNCTTLLATACHSSVHEAAGCMFHQHAVHDAVSTRSQLSYVGINDFAHVWLEPLGAH